MLGEVLGVERRRRWSDDEKLEILLEVGVGGASVTQVAQRHELTRSQVYGWRRDLKKKGLWSPDPQHSRPMVDAFRQETTRLKAMDQALADTPGDNVQTAVDTETHLIVAHDVTNQGFDRDQLSPMAAAAREALQTTCCRCELLLRLGDRQPIRPSAQATIRVVGARRWRAPATAKNSLFVSIRSDYSAKTESHRD
ncbi:transposase [Rhodovulum sulfidophilum]|nr:transposase [Rhodovulum sulfidophilum]